MKSPSLDLKLELNLNAADAVVVGPAATPPKLGTLAGSPVNCGPKLILGSTALLSVLLDGCVDVTAHGLVKYPGSGNVGLTVG